MRFFKPVRNVCALLSACLLVSTAMQPTAVLADASRETVIVQDSAADQRGTISDEPDSAQIASEDDAAGQDQGVIGDTTDDDDGASIPSSELPSISADATFDDFIEYAQEHLQGMPVPQHAWGDMGGVAPLSASDPYWRTSGSGKTFYTGYGDVYASPAILVLDVSQWQGVIDWDAVKASGVDAVILRFGWGWGNLDSCFERNLQEIRRVGLPYGLYMYSYAYDATTAAYEAQWTAEVLNRYGTSGMELPLYYDLENWGSWSEDGITYQVPSTVAQYESIVSSYVSTLTARGYSNVHVYSYRSYCQTVLNSPDILSRTSWIAEYGPELQMDNPYYSGQYGWQYTSTGSVDGIAGNVDLSAFSSFDYLNVTYLPSVDLPDGTYYINAHLKDSSGVQVNGAVSGSALELMSYGESAEQRFIFMRQGDGSYVITNEASGLALDVRDADPFDGAVVQQFTPNGSDAQCWFIRDSGAGYYLQSKLGNWVLDISGACAADGTAITLHTPNGTDAQRFMMASPSDVLEDTHVNIASALNQNMVLDVYGGSLENVAAIQLYSANDTDAQIFTFTRVGNGIYEITNSLSGKAVEVSGGATANGSKVAQYTSNGTLSQHWSVRNNEDGTVTLININTGKALDVSSGIAASGTQLQIYASNGTDAQKWTIRETTTLRQRIDQLAADNKGTIAEGVYAIGSSTNERQVLDVSGGSTVDGANVQLYASNGTQAQRWQISEDTEGYLTIINVGSNKALDVSSGSTADATNVQQYVSNSSWAQKWVAVQNDDGSYTFHSALDTDLVLDLYGGVTSNGANVDVFTSNSTSAQKFKLYKADSVTTGSRPIDNGTYVLHMPDGRVLDVPGASASDGVQLQAYVDNGTVAQAFTFAYDVSRGLYSIRSASSGRMLDADNGDIVPGASVSQWGTAENSVTQRYWELRDQGNGSYLIVNAASGKVLGISAAGLLITVNADDAREVSFVFERSSYLASIDDLNRKASEQGTILPDGEYRIASGLADSKVLDVEGGSLSDGANVQLYEANGTGAQRWRVINDGAGFIRIQNIQSGKYLDIASGISVAGTNVWQYDGNSTDAQKWLPVRQPDGSFVLYSALGNRLVLDVSGGSTANGTNIQVYTVNGTGTQAFGFEVRK